MSKIEKICHASCDNWINTFPKEAPEHIFSEAHNKKMKPLLIYGNDTKHTKLSKKTFKALLIAAILLSVSITAFAISKNKDFIIEKFSTFSNYEVIDAENAEKVTSLKVNYVPEGFKKTEEHNGNGFYIKKYDNKQKTFTVTKSSIKTTVGFDTEEYDSKSISINGNESVLYKSDDVYQGIIYNNGKFIYDISGNISTEELVKIAQELE